MAFLFRWLRVGLQLFSDSILSPNFFLPLSHIADCLNDWVYACIFLFICSHCLIPIKFCFQSFFFLLFWSSSLQLACFCTVLTYGTPGLVSCRQTPLQIIHILGNFLRIWSIYSMYNYLSQTGASVVLFIFSCLVPASVILLLLQKPWKGRPLSNTQVKKLSFTIACFTLSFSFYDLPEVLSVGFQVVPSIINGGVTALYFVLWGKGLKVCGPLR